MSNRRQNRGHTLAVEIQQIADHIQVTQNLNQTAVWIKLSKLAADVKVFSDVFADFVHDGAK